MAKFTDWRMLEYYEIFEDKYAWRYVHRYDHRVEAYKFYLGSCRYSDTMAFWYKDYASPEDAVIAAKLWCCRGELERLPDSMDEYTILNLAPDLYRQVDPSVVKRGW